jgi:hypothetical protein
MSDGRVNVVPVKKKDDAQTQIQTPTNFPSL